MSTPTASPCILATAGAAAAAAAAGGGGGADGGGGDGGVADDAGDEPNETAPMLGLHYDVDDQHTRSYSTDRTCFAHAVGRPTLHYSLELCRPHLTSVD